MMLTYLYGTNEIAFQTQDSSTTRTAMKISTVFFFQYLATSSYRRVLLHQQQQDQLVCIFLLTWLPINLLWEA